MPGNVLDILIIVFSLLLVAHSFFNVYLALYVWSNPQRIEDAKAPKKYRRPKHGFTVLLPCRNEEAVIGETIRRLSLADYPKDLFELLVLCTPDDPDTIEAAQRSIDTNKITNARVIVFDLPAGKSRGMNIGLSEAKHDLITIFDSEDDVSPEIFNIANTIFCERYVDILQCGVQLMDFDTRWFSAHNVLEYFFWFKSRMHFYAKSGIVPLGGNTVFFRRSDLREVGGWDEQGLTEDADIGIRLSLRGKRFGVMYDAKHVTREETPATVAAFVKQRTRWNQGFIQIVAKNEWRKLRTRKQIALLLYILGGPSFMAGVFVTAPFIILAGVLGKVNVAVSLFAFLPLFLSWLALLIGLIGLYEFGKEQHKKVRIRNYIIFTISFLPYQILLAVAAVRAAVREARGNTGWEKTAHAGAHRSVESSDSSEPATNVISTEGAA
ncbi:glycosyl transferase [Candidatus Saccharibacteria bacterium]|nr:MAG: glycosyl transferase [Candidatus Saccharibacteria bacterium]